MDAATKERMVEACVATWNAVGYDILQTQEDGSMSAEDAQSCAADYVDTYGDVDDWWNLTYEEHHECLAVAIPEDVCM